MILIDPEVQVEHYDGTKIMKKLERACRTCYRSESNISEDSYKNLLTNCIGRGHESVLEHEKISIKLICDVGVYKDLTRHRLASFSIESTRYCNYSKDKFDNQIKFIKPVFYDEEWMKHNYEGSAIGSENALKSSMWYNCMEDIEAAYQDMAKIGCKPDELRLLLPHSTAAEVYMTANIREWKHILSLRTQKMVHPSVQQVMIPLLIEFQRTMPEIFNTIEYNKDFDSNKYAKLYLTSIIQ